MSRIAAEPPASVHSLDDLLAIAHAMETDAQNRYRETARLLRARDALALADLFDRLAAEEAGHAKQVEDWARDAQRGPPAGRPTPWPIPDTFDTSPEEAGRSSALTPYRALSAAVRHEERAFSFWSYVAAHAERSDVRQAAEEMAREELEHVSLLRRERRKAFHEQRLSAPAHRLTSAALAEMEDKLAGLLEAPPRSLPDMDRERFAADARAMSQRLRSTEQQWELPGDVPDFGNDILAVAEFLVESYLRLADEIKDEAVVTLAQTHAAAAIRRLAALNEGDRPPLREQ